MAHVEISTRIDEMSWGERKCTVRFAYTVALDGEEPFPLLRWEIGPFEFNPFRPPELKDGRLELPVHAAETVLHSRTFRAVHVGRHLVLDPDGAYGTPEIVHVTGTGVFARADGSHSYSVDVVRGMEATTARSHPEGTRYTWGLRT